MRLTVIVTCLEPWPAARQCLDRLVPQARPGEIEILSVDGSGGGTTPPMNGPVRWLSSPGLGPHDLRMLGLARAQGDVVAITEDHCEVSPDWCERLLCAHARHPDAVAVAGTVTNGAVARAVDRASFYLVHARNLPDNRGRTGDWFPPVGSNVSYKRDQLLRLVEERGDLELVVTPQLWSQGLLAVDEDVKVTHSQSLGAVAHVTNHFHSARSHAGLVAQRGIGRGRRALARDAVAFPLRLLGATLGVGRDLPRCRTDMRRLLPAMTVLAMAAAAGYLTGVTGPGSSPRRMR